MERIKFEVGAENTRRILFGPEHDSAVTLVQPRAYRIHNAGPDELRVYVSSPGMREDEPMALRIPADYTVDVIGAMISAQAVSGEVTGWFQHLG